MVTIHGNGQWVADFQRAEAADTGSSCSSSSDVSAQTVWIPFNTCETPLRYLGFWAVTGTNNNDAAVQRLQRGVMAGLSRAYSANGPLAAIAMVKRDVFPLLEYHVPTLSVPPAVLQSWDN